MKFKAETGFVLVLLFSFLGGLYLTFEWSMKARLYPMVLMIGGIIFSLVLFFSQMLHGSSENNKKKEENKRKVKQGKEKATPRAEAVMALWLLFFLGIILVAGFWVASALFPLLFLVLFGRENWKIVTGYTTGIWFAIYITFQVGMKTPLYTGILNLSF